MSLPPKTKRSAAGKPRKLVWRACRADYCLCARLGRDELRRTSERCAEKEEECRRLEDEGRRMQERISELENVRKELAGAHLEDGRSGTPHSLRSSRKGGGSGSPAKSQSAVGMVVVEQLEELRASHGRERLVKEKQMIQLQSELKRAGRQVLSLQQRLSDIQREYDVCQNRLRESESSLLHCNKELADVKLQLKMAQQEGEDVRHLLQQSQLALERDRRRLTDDEAVKTILGGVAALPRSSQPEQIQRERQLLASIGPLVAEGEPGARARGVGGGGNRLPAADGDGAWEVEMNRLLSTIGELDKEDQQLRAQVRREVTGGWGGGRCDVRCWCDNDRGRMGDR